MKKESSSRKGFINNISVGSVIGIIIFLEILVAVGGWKYKDNFLPLSSFNINTEITNAHALGNVFVYRLYSFISDIRHDFIGRHDRSHHSYI